MQSDALDGGCLCRGIAGIALIDVGELDLLAGCVLYIRAQAADRGPVADIGRCHVQSEQVAERVDGHVHLRAALALGAVIAGARAAFGGGPQRSAIDDGGCRIGRSTTGQAQQGPQILGERLEAPRGQPALRLLIHGGPRWKVVRHGPPGDVVADHVAQRVEQFPQRVIALWRCLRHQRQIRHHQRPFLVADVRRIRLAMRSGAHPIPLSATARKVHNTL